MSAHFLRVGLVIAAGALSVGTWVPAAHAEAKSDLGAALAKAELSYQNVDFATAYQEVHRALEFGSAREKQAARLYLLLGTSAAALGKTEEATQAFVTALAIQPDLRLERNLSPKLRKPYLEAQGYWGTYAERLTLDVKADADAERLTLRLEDPAHLVHRVLVFLRAPGSQAYDIRVLVPAAEAQAVSTSKFARAGFEYYVSLLDAHNNSLRELGSEDAPVLVRSAHLSSPIGARPIIHQYWQGLPGEPTPSNAQKSPTPDSPTSNAPAPNAPKRSESLLLPTILTSGGVLALGAGALFHIRRERDAEKWNSPRCEQPGLTRIEQCPGLDQQRRQAQQLAVGFYATGGALLATGLFLWARHASSEKAHDTRPASGALHCGASVPGIWCSGEF